MTLINQCQELLNARPLIATKQDAAGTTLLTPNSFLKSSAGEGWELSSKEIMNEYSKLNKKHSVIQQQLEENWERFLNEYLPTLKKCNDWLNSKKKPKVGDMVLVLDRRIKDRDTPWPKAIVTGVTYKPTGPQGTLLVARVKIRMAHSKKEFERDLRDLAPLDLDTLSGIPTLY